MAIPFRVHATALAVVAALAPLPSYAEPATDLVAQAPSNSPAAAPAPAGYTANPTIVDTPAALETLIATLKGSM